MKILVRGTNWIGDSVMSIPALRELRRIFPDDHITLHIRSWAEGLFAEASFIDEIVPYDPQKWKIKDAIDNSDFLRDDGYELAVLFPNSFESALTTWLTRIPRRIGYNKDLRGLLLTDPVPVPEWKSRRHEVYYYLNLIAEAEKRVLGRASVGNFEPNSMIDVSAARRDAAVQMLASRGADLSKPIVAIAAGSANSPEKRWPAVNFAAVADRLSSEFQCSVFLVGSKDDAAISAGVQAAASSELIDLTAQTTLEEAVGTLSAVDVVISNDAGLAHVSAAAGTPTIIVFGPTDPTTTRPFSNNAYVIQGEPWPSVDTVVETARMLLSEKDERESEASSIR